MPYKNIPLANLRKLANRTTPALAAAAVAVDKADLQQIVDGLIAMKICKTSGDDEVVRHGPYTNIKISDLNFGTTKAALEMTDGSTPATLNQVNALITALKNTGLFKASGAADHKHGPYSNVYLKNLRRRTDDYGSTPNVAGTIDEPPTAPQYDNILWALQRMGLTDIKFPIIITEGGTGTGVIDPAAGTTYLNTTDALDVTITPDVDNRITVFDVDGADALGDIADIEAAHVHSIGADNAAAITIDVEFEPTIYDITMTVGGDGQGSVTPLAGVHPTRYDATLLVIIVPTGADTIGTFTVGGVDKSGELVEAPAGTFKYTIPAAAGDREVVVNFTDVP